MNVINGGSQIPILKNNNDLFQTKKKLIVRRLEQCKGYTHLPLLFHNMIITRDPETEEVVFDFELIVREEVGHNFAVSNSFKYIICVENHELVNFDFIAVEENKHRF